MSVSQIHWAVKAKEKHILNDSSSIYRHRVREERGGVVSWLVDLLMIYNLPKKLLGKICI